jgi:two-component system, NarL family, nitrate/nitrite response regulator NarL
VDSRRVTERRVLLAGVARLFAEAVADVIARGDHVTVDVCDIDGIVDHLRETPVDVVVIGDADGESDRVAHTAEAVRELVPDAHVIVVTGTLDLEFALHADERGIDAIVPSEASLGSLLAALDATGSYAGDAGFAPRSRLELVPPAQVTLTPRELEVLRLLSEGLGARAIADRVGLSVHTVRDHIKSVLRKLAAHSQLEAVVTATRRGLV